MKLFIRLIWTAAVGASAVWGQFSPASINPLPSREFGHAKLNIGTLSLDAPNLIEGKELFAPSSLAFDTSTGTPVLYVADLLNHRVLAWKNPSTLTLANQADKVIGQRDFYKTFVGGPGRTDPALGSAGMALPSGVAVDTSGNLYVFDAGNNRILRFPKPMEQQGEFVLPDLVIGQKSAGSGNQANQGQPKPTEKTLASNRGGVFHGSLAFDAQGNLWVTDSGNHRVLRYPRSNLSGSEPAADLVLGQNSFVSDDPASGNQLVNGLLLPTGIAVDPGGNVFVTDNGQRVLYYAAPTSSMNPTRILGIQPTPTVQNPAVPVPNTYSVGRKGSEAGIPQCVFLSGTIPFVCDNVANRIVRYNAAPQWAAASTDVPSPASVSAYGQNNMLTGDINRGQGPARPESNTFFRPTAGAIFNNELWVADAGNNRILVLGQSSPLEFTIGTRAVGQPRFDTNGVNLVEGRDLHVSFTPSDADIQERDMCAAIGGNFRGSAVAIDRSSSPNRLYVADSINNRILGFKDARAVGTDVRTLLTQEADVIIGQADKYHKVPNYPNSDRQSPSDQGLCTPTGVAVDAVGDLWVADTGNGRLVRFPSPFNQQPGVVRRANKVLGQPSFTFKITDASSSTMSLPVSVVIFNNGDIGASDIAHNRVLIFRKTGADFGNGQAARAVLGQPDFNSSNASSAANGMNRPRGIAIDSSDRLYVADSANNRLIEYTSVTTTPFVRGTISVSLNSPEGVAISNNTGEIWVASTNNNAIFRFFESQFADVAPTPTAAIASAAPIGLALDEFDNIIAVEAVNRITFYFPRLIVKNAASSAGGSNLIPSLAPGLYVYSARLGQGLDLTDDSPLPPYPKTLSGIRVLVDGLPAAIAKIVGKQLLYFFIPNNAPSSGKVEIVVLRESTGQILATGTFPIGPVAPALFTEAGDGTGQISACNYDEAAPSLPCPPKNGRSNPVAQGKIMILALTGYGHLDNAPPDGEIPTGIVHTPEKPVISIGAHIVPPERILFSGLSPFYPGLWQINVVMPKVGDVNAPVPGEKVPIIVRYRDVPSNIGGTNNLDSSGNSYYLDRVLDVGTNGLITTVATKQ